MNFTVKFSVCLLSDTFFYSTEKYECSKKCKTYYDSHPSEDIHLHMCVPESGTEYETEVLQPQLQPSCKLV